MSLHNQKEFLQSHHPFDKLTSTQLELCFKNIDIGYYPKDTILISPTKISKYFFIIIKGEVNEYVSNELIHVYHNDDSFDSDSLIYNKTNSTFNVVEDLICYELKKDIFLKVLQENEKFKKFYLSDLANKLQDLKTKEYANDMSSFMVSRVSELYLHKPCIVDKSCLLDEAIKKSVEYKTSTIVVTNNDNYGIITDSILKKDVLLKGKKLDIPVDQITKYPFICVDINDFLFQVLLILTKHSIKRVGVLENNKLVGIIEQIDILSYFANHIHLIATQIDKASTLDNLRQASIDITKSVKSLFVKSVKTTYIAKMVSQLNEKMYQKLFSLTVPKEIQEHCAFLVMGSEGRDEQILKTDQDNALIIDDSFDKELFVPYMEQISNTLIDFGFPKCDGNIMVNNPFWRKTTKEFSNQIEKWLDGKNMEDYMNLAIFFDSKVVAGNGKYLEQLKQFLFNKIDNKDIFMAYFAKSTLNFDTPIGLFSNLKAKGGLLDIKKGAIFAIVQGVRSLALEAKLTQHSTIARIKELNNQNILEKDLASELIEAFGLLLRLRLQFQMEQLNDGKTINNSIDIKKLSKIEKDMLKDSFKIVNRFKSFISHHFRLDNIS